jgi:RNA methyltransferase, TrmH family
VNTGLISSAANPVSKRMRLLADRRHRRREAAFVVEGIQPVSQAVAAGAEIESLVVAPELLTRSPGGSLAAAMVAAQESRGIRVTRMTAELFTRLSSRDGPSGLAAIVRGRPAGLASLRVPAGALFVALHGIANPGNLGTIIRTADAAGAAGVVLLGSSTDPFDPAAVKASMGALFSVPVAHEPDVTAFLSWAQQAGVAVITTSGQAADSFWDTRFPRPAAFLLGAEGPGLPAGILARGDLAVRIPMVGTAESLNLAVAASLLLYEAQRQAGGLPGRGAP